MKCVISGASSGFGREIAIELSKVVKAHPLRLVLLGRRREALQQTKDLALAAAPTDQLDIVVLPCDLSQLDALPALAKEVFQKDEFSKEAFTFVNNAGDVHPLSYIGEGIPLPGLQKAMDLNVTSALHMSSSFVESCVSSERDRPERCTLVNVSSLCAIEPFASMGVYCAGKAARDMFHRVLAKETEKITTLKVLNYAPGPMNTEMHAQIRSSASVDKEIRKHFEESFNAAQTVDPNHSAKRLLDIILNYKFQSGQHIDYYDLEK